MNDNDTIIDVYEKLFNTALANSAKITVGSSFHTQVKNIDSLLNNDVTGMVSTIYDFMVQCACVPIQFESKNNTLNTIFSDWLNNLNSNINKDIPRGFRSFSEQYFRERWRSSFIVLNIEWGNIGGYSMPVKMWFSNGKSIYAKRETDNLRATKYYLDKKMQNELSDDLKHTYLIRKPYNAWYDLYPTPYFVKKGTLYHSLFKENVLNKQGQGVAQVFPALFAIKMGCELAMKNNQMPTKEDMQKMQENVKNLRDQANNRQENNGLIGTFPFDVNFENLLPDFAKILDEKVTQSIDRNILMSLGMIEFKGFSTTREEAVLNPKPLISEIEDAVADFVELIDDIIYQIRERNKADNKRKFSSKEINISVAPIKGIMTDKMKELIRSLYDRGVLCKQDTVEGLTSFDFTRQVEKRKQEANEGLEDTMFAPVILNQDNKTRDDIKACLENLDEKQKEIFNTAYNSCKKQCAFLDYDEDFTEKVSIEWALNAIKKEYIEAPYTKDNYPAQLKKLPVGARNLWIRVFNRILKDTGDEDQARQGAWHDVKLKYKKDGDKWVKKSK